MSLDSFKLYKQPACRERNNSGEIDVFEAARYFSGITKDEPQVVAYNNNVLVSNKSMKEGAWGGARKSLDLPMEKNPNPIPPYSHKLEKHSKEKKPKPPCSPSRKFTSFLNSLFTQTAKKKTKSPTQSTRDEDDSLGCRRSSISQRRDIGNTDVKSIYCSSSSGVRTPPGSSTEIYEELGSVSDPCKGKPRSVNIYHDNLDQKPRFIDGRLDKDGTYTNGNYRNWVLEKDEDSRNCVWEKDGIWSDEYSKEKRFRKDMEIAADGGESESSSDLFELENYDLDFYSNDLPVYEITHLENMKRGPAIVRGSL